MNFDDATTIQGFPHTLRQVNLRAARLRQKPKRETPRDLRAATGIVYATVGGIGVYAWAYVLFLWLTR